MGVNDIKKWRVFRKIASISGIEAGTKSILSGGSDWDLRTIQGLTWLVMAATCIGMYYGPVPSKIKTFSTRLIDNQTRYIDLISFSFYDTLLDKNNNVESRLLKPQFFHVFAWVYVVLSTFWLCLAISECVALFRRKSSKYDTHVLMLSGITTVVICLLDLIVMSLAFHDYFKIKVFEYDVFDWDTTTAPPTVKNLNVDLLADDGTGTKEVFEVNIDLILRYRIGRKLSYGILIAIVTRGFVIWIFNCVSGVILLLISLKIFQAPPILKYDNRSIPRPKRTHKDRHDGGSLFGSTFAEDSNYYSTPPSQPRRYSVASGDQLDRYGREQGRNNPLALRDNNRRSENRFS